MLKWSLIKHKTSRPFQKDTYNCGVFVMYFMYCIANGIQMDKNFNPNLFRPNVAKMLLNKSLDISGTCLYCFLDKGTCLVMCKYCRRYAHKECIPGKKKSIAKWNTAEFRCSLCACTVRQWMVRH